MLELGAFHEQLIQVACGQDDLDLPPTPVSSMSAGFASVSLSQDYRQTLALDILSWIAALQMNSVHKRCRKQKKRKWGRLKYWGSTDSSY